MRTILILSLVISFIFASLPMQAQQSEKLRVAVFDPASTGNKIDEGITVAVRELISSALVNSNKFTIVERSLLDKVMKEQQFSNSGAVDASQASELGKLAGANKVIISVLTQAGSRTMLSIKMIDVQTAGVENQKVKTLNAIDELFEVAESLTLAMIGEEIPIENNNSASKSLSIKNLFGSKNQDKSSQTKKEVSQEKEKPEISFESSSSPVNGNDVIFEFSGVNNGKNPTAQLFIDGKSIGTGTLNQGFSIQMKDSRPGAHTLKVEWSGTVVTKSFKINTSQKTHYLFEYVTGGFGYTFNIKN